MQWCRLGGLTSDDHLLPDKLNISEFKNNMGGWGFTPHKDKQKPEGGGGVAPPHYAYLSGHRKL